jgi:beta-N-acetylhexosaminidase
MSIRRLIGQHLIIGLKGTTLLREEEDLIVRNNIGGVVLMGRNCESPEQVFDLIDRVQALRSRMQDRVPVFVSVDMEGGRVLRMRGDSFTPWPALAKIGEIGSASVAYQFAHQMAEELVALGFNLNFAPCLDVLANSQSTVIGDRALGSDPEVVAKLGSAIARGYLKSGLLPCGKHFPGHGHTPVDSHHDLPVDQRTKADLERGDLEPYRRSFRAKLPLVMSAHLMMPSLDPDWPVSLSSQVITGLLKAELRFRGLVVTDDLGMKALSARWSLEEIAVRALQAGNHLLLNCNELDFAERALAAIETAVGEKKLSLNSLTENVKQIHDLKASLAEAKRPARAAALSLIASEKNRRLAEAIASGHVPADLLTQPSG